MIQGRHTKAPAKGIRMNSQSLAPAVAAAALILAVPAAAQSEEPAAAQPALVGFLVKSGEVDLPAGTRANARVPAATSLPPRE